jgi:hypothetical protein
MVQPQETLAVRIASEKATSDRKIIKSTSPITFCDRSKLSGDVSILLEARHREILQARRRSSLNSG